MTVNNVSYKKKWNAVIRTSARGSTPDSTNKKQEWWKLDKYFVKIKLFRDTKSEKSNLYELKMDLFDNGNPDEFLLFIHNFNTTLEEPGTLKAGANIQYLHTLLRG